jgi:hypothetical protein
MPNFEIAYFPGQFAELANTSHKGDPPVTALIAQRPRASPDGVQPFLKLPQPPVHTRIFDMYARGVYHIIYVI